MLYSVALSYYPQEITQTIPNGLPPAHLLMAIGMSLWAFIVITQHDKLIINRLFTLLGQASFSVYILHFAVLKWVAALMSKYWMWPKTGIFSIFYVFIMIFITTVGVGVFARFTYKHIELPFIKFGKRIASGASSEKAKDETPGGIDVPRMPNI